MRRVTDKLMNKVQALSAEKDKIRKELKEREDEAQSLYERKAHYKKLLDEYKDKVKALQTKLQKYSPVVKSSREISAGVSVRIFFKLHDLTLLARIHMILHDLCSLQKADKERKFERKCPMPDCRHRFNYHSNMMRHYRKFHSKESRFR